MKAVRRVERIGAASSCRTVEKILDLAGRLRSWITGTTERRASGVDWMRHREAECHQGDEED